MNVFLSVYLVSAALSCFVTAIDTHRIPIEELPGEDYATDFPDTTETNLELDIKAENAFSKFKESLVEEIETSETKIRETILAFDDSIHKLKDIVSKTEEQKEYELPAIDIPTNPLRDSKISDKCYNEYVSCKDSCSFLACAKCFSVIVACALDESIEAHFGKPQ